MLHPRDDSALGATTHGSHVREMAEFVNIYSRDRGINRFLALVKLFDLLGSAAPAIPGVRAWIQRETKLGNESLRIEVERTGNADLLQAYQWSLAVNARIEELVRNCPPFPLVRESLEHVSQWADILVTSTTPCEALRREWSEHAIEHYPAVIAGQELGAKREHIGIVMAQGYDRNKAIMIGDAPGDLQSRTGQRHSLLSRSIRAGRKGRGTISSTKPQASSEAASTRAITSRHWLRISWRVCRNTDSLLHRQYFHLAFDPEQVVQK